MRQHNGEVLKRLRKARGYTQEELGMKLGVTKATVQKYESGDIVNLKLETIKKLCDIFHVNPVKFIFEDENERVKKEVEAIEIIQEAHGRPTIECLTKFTLLNEMGQEKILNVLDDFLELDKYKEKDAQ